MSLSGIHFSGVASGLNIDGIVSSLMQIEQIPIQRMQRSQAKLQNQQAALSSFRSQLQQVGSSISNLAQASTYNPVSASSSDTTVATISAGSNANAGTFNLEVLDLAQAHKVASAGQASSANALGLSGKVVVNGKSMDIGSGDSLSAIASRITNLGVGVSASVIDGGTGQAYISLSAQNTGKTNQIQLADATGGVFQSLGLINGTPSVRSGTSSSAVSVGFADASSKLSTLTGLSSTGTVTLNGHDVSLDFGQDSLQGIADKINGASSGITATVVSSSQNGKTVQQLQLNGANLASSISDPSGMLNQLGVFQNGFGNELLKAQDASFKVDGLTLSSATNQVTGVIPGATVNLVKKGASTTLGLTRDVTQIKKAITDFQSSFNGFVDNVNSLTKYDAKAGTTGALFGDSTVQAIQQSLTSMVTSTLGNGTYTNLTQVGVSLDQDGKIAIDDAKLTNALNSNLNDVKSLLMASGSGSNASISYVSSTEKTLGSGSSYGVNITQVATKSRMTATVAQTGSTAAGEVLTFGGQMFGNLAYTMALDAGMSSADIVSKINNDSKLKDLIGASLTVDGKLQLDSKKFGSAGRFTLNSNQNGSATNSGIGFAPDSVLGMDVAGTINGETATGSGQYLLGLSGNKNTEGLQIQYTGSTTGDIGSVTFNRGAANSLRGKISSFLDSVNGLLTIEDKSIQSQVDDISKQITDATNGLSAKETAYRNKFTAMESAIAALQSQSGQLGSMLSASSSSK